MSDRSIIWYIACVMAFIWRTGTGNTVLTSSHDALWPRIVLTVVLGVGVLYFILIMTTFRRYGDIMDRAWRARVVGWLQEAVDGQLPQDPGKSGKPADDMGAFLAEGHSTAHSNMSSSLGDRASGLRVKGAIPKGVPTGHPDIPFVEYGLSQLVPNDAKARSLKDLKPRQSDVLVSSAWRTRIIDPMKRLVNRRGLHDAHKSEGHGMEARVTARHSTDSHDTSLSMRITSGPVSDGAKDIPVQANVMGGHPMGKIELPSVEGLNPTPGISEVDLAGLQEDHEERNALRVVAFLSTSSSDASSQTVSSNILDRYQYDSQIWSEFIKVRCF